MTVVTSTDELLQGGWFSIDVIGYRTVDSQPIARQQPLKSEGWLFSNFHDKGFFHFKTEAGSGASFAEDIVDTWIKDGLVVALPGEAPEIAQPGARSRVSGLAERVHA